MYFPSWQEIATTILPVAYGILLIMVSYRYLPIFPQEAELNPIETVSDTDTEPELEQTEESQTGTEETDLKPAEA